MSSAFEKHPGRSIAAAFAIVCVLLTGWWYWLATGSSRIDFLDGRGPAQWIVFPKIPDAQIHWCADVEGIFRQNFVLGSTPTQATLELRALRHWSAVVNGASQNFSDDPAQNWKEISTRNIAALLHAGTNEIVVTVYNTNGPPALWLSLTAGDSQLVSDTNWNVSLGGSIWRQAAPASASARIATTPAFRGAERPVPALLHCLPLLAFFAAISGVAFYGGQRLIHRRNSREPSELSRAVFGRLAWVLAVPVVLWLILFCNNLGVLPFVSGFDSVQHLDYMKRIATQWRLPLAGEGYQTYQPPLYYLLSTLWALPFQPGGWTDRAAEVVRVLGLVIGVANFVLVFLCLRLLFPGRLGPQFAGLLLAAFVPEQLYIAQYVTNELLAATLVTAAFYFCLRIANDDRDDPWNYGALGICLGLSLLTKVTALVAVPVLGAVLAGRLYLKGRRLPAEWARTVGVSVAACAVICGWYYIRNLLTFGQAVIGNWDAAGGGQRWWLDPGYAVAGRFFHGGNFFAYPWFGGFNSFVGGLYSTLWGDGLWGGAVKIDFRAPWNYQLMATGYLLALFPTLLILAGAGVLASRNIRQPRAAGLLVLGTAGVMLAAMITMALKVPSYGEAKAFYGLLALMPMCAMLAAGWEQLERAGKWLVPVAAVLLGVWVLTSYGAFWIPRWNPQTQVTNGRIFEDLGRLDDARKWFDQVVARDPQNLDAAKGLAATAFKDKKYDEARQRIGAVIQAAPDDPVAHSHLSSILAAQDQTSDAVTELAKSQALATNRLENFLQYSDLLLKAKNGAFASIISRTALALNPYSAEAHYGLAAVCVNIGRDAEALDHFRVAVQLRPHWAQAEEQLGLSLLGARQSDAALPLLNDAAAQNPNDVTMLFNLGVGLNAVGQSADAIQAYRRALTLNPDYPDALNNLAWLLATDADPQLRNGGDAIQLAGHACDLTRRQRPVFLATLGAGYAETGRFDDAATTTKQAQDLARSAGDSNFVATCGKLLEFYSTDRAYHQPARAR